MSEPKTISQLGLGGETYTILHVEKYHRVHDEAEVVVHDALLKAIEKTGFEQHFFVVLIGAASMSGLRDEQALGLYMQNTNTIVLAAAHDQESCSKERFIYELKMTILHEFFHMVHDCEFGLGEPDSNEVEDPAEEFALSIAGSEVPE